MCDFASEILGFFTCEMGMVLSIVPVIETITSVTIGVNSGFSVKIGLLKLIWLCYYWSSYPKVLKNYLQLSYLSL